MIVVIEARWMALARTVVRHRRTVDQQNVHPPVVVVVECGGATALGFNDVQLLLSAASQAKINSSGAGDVNEQWWICRGILHAGLLRSLCHRTFVCRCRVLRGNRLRNSRQNPTGAQ